MENYTKINNAEKNYHSNIKTNRIIKDISNIDNNEIDDIPLGFFIESIFRHYSTYLNMNLKDFDLTAKQVYIILILYNKENLNQETIASILNSNEVTTTREINNLEKKELITRKIDENDKRKKIVELTEKGKTVANLSMNFSRKSEDYLNEHMSPEELHILRILLKKLILVVNKTDSIPIFRKEIE